MVLKVYNHFSRGNGFKWLKTLHDSKLAEFINKAVEDAIAILKKVNDALEKLQDYLIGSRSLFGFIGRVFGVNDDICHFIRGCQNSIDAIKGQLQDKAQLCLNDIQTRLAALIKQKPVLPKQKMSVSDGATAKIYATSHQWSGCI